MRIYLRGYENERKRISRLTRYPDASDSSFSLSEFIKLAGKPRKE